MTFDHSPEFASATTSPSAVAELAAPRHRPEAPLTAGDVALMVLVAEGDVAAFTVIVERHSPRLYRVAYRMLGNAAEAEDVVQEGFSKLWQSASRWGARDGGLPGWLHRVVVNSCLDRLRRYRVVGCDELPEVADESPSPERALAIQRLGLAVEDALASLPGRHRAAIVLCYFEGMSNIMAAQVLDLNLKAMESLLFRVRRTLRELLEQRGVRSEDLELLQ